MKVVHHDRLVPLRSGQDISGNEKNSAKHAVRIPETEDETSDSDSEEDDVNHNADELVHRYNLRQHRPARLIENSISWDAIGD